MLHCLPAEDKAQERFLRDSIYNSGSTRAASKEETEKNTRRMWYGEARSIEFPPKVNEHFIKSC